MLYRLRNYLPRATYGKRMLYLFNQLQFTSNTADSNEICMLPFVL